MKNLMLSGIVTASLFLYGCGGNVNPCLEPVVVNKFNLVVKDMDTGDIVCRISTGQDDFSEVLGPQGCSATIDDDPISQTANIHVEKEGYVASTIEGASYSVDSCGQGRTNGEIEVYLLKVTE